MDEFQSLSDTKSKRKYHLDSYVRQQGLLQTLPCPVFLHLKISVKSNLADECMD